MNKSALRIAGIAGLLLLTMGIAHAANAPGVNPPSQQSVGLFNQVMNEFINASVGWYSVIYGYAMDLFGLLVGLEISWMGLMWMLTRKYPEEMIPSFAKKVIMIGFFLFLLLNTQQVAYTIINSFANIGLIAGGLGQNYLSPSTIIGDGLVGFEQILSGGFHVVQSSPGSSGGGGVQQWIVSAVANATGLNAISTVLSSAVNTLIAFFTGFIFFMALLFVAMEYMIIEVQAAFVMAAGPLLIAFGGSRWTVHYSQSYLQYAVSVGIRLLVIELFVSLVLNHILPLIVTQLNSVTNSNQMMSSIVAMTAVLVLAVLARSLPKIATEMLTGQSTASGEGLSSAVTRTAIGGAAVAAGGAMLAAGAGSAAFGAAGRVNGSGGAGSLGPSGGGGPNGAGSLGASSASPDGGASADVPAPRGGRTLNAQAGGTPAGGAPTSAPSPSGAGTGGGAAAPEPATAAPSSVSGGDHVRRAVAAGKATHRALSGVQQSDPGSQLSSHVSVSAPAGNIRHADD